jgi:hypothetical protein
MAKFAGEVGFGWPTEKAPGVFEDVILEKVYFGDVIRNTRQLKEGENLLPNLAVSNSISIVADAYANEHFFAIRYLRWMGVLWTVSEVEVQHPRLLLRLGGPYNGPTA